MLQSRRRSVKAYQRFAAKTQSSLEPSTEKKGAEKSHPSKPSDSTVPTYYQSQLARPSNSTSSPSPPPSCYPTPITHSALYTPSISVSLGPPVGERSERPASHCSPEPKTNQLKRQKRFFVRSFNFNAFMHAYGSRWNRRIDCVALVTNDGRQCLLLLGCSPTEGP